MYNIPNDVLGLSLIANVRRVTTPTCNVLPRVTGHLGSGYFGQVKQGVWVNDDKEVDVAMKTLNKQVVRDVDQIKFLQEAAIMAQFRHPNIVTLYGITYKEEPVSL